MFLSVEKPCPIAHITVKVVGLVVVGTIDLPNDLKLNLTLPAQHDVRVPELFIFLNFLIWALLSGQF